MRTNDVDEMVRQSRLDKQEQAPEVIESPPGIAKEGTPKQTRAGRVVRSGVSPHVPDDLRTKFEKFRADPTEALRIAVRRRRAAELRSLVADPDAVDLQTFNREVWVIAEPRKQGEAKSLFERLFGTNTLSAAERQQFEASLADPATVLRGNWLWRAATGVIYPTPRVTDEQRLAAVRAALQVLNDGSLPLLEKARRIDDQPGFGPSVASGLVMAFHPTEFAVYNGPSQEALSRLGFDVSTMEAFEQAVAKFARQSEPMISLNWTGSCTSNLQLCRRSRRFGG